MKYTFYWSPEGSPLGTFEGTLAQATREFKRECPKYARFMGEVYAMDARVKPSDPLHGPMERHTSALLERHSGILGVNA